MGTHAVIYVLEKDLTPVLSLYCQYDGYMRKPGIGWRLDQFLEGRSIVDGICHSDTWREVSNGMTDLGAQLVWALKKDSMLGGIYLNPLPKLPKHGQVLTDYLPILVKSPSSDLAEYLYVIYESTGGRPVLWWMQMTGDAIRNLGNTLMESVSGRN